VLSIDRHVNGDNQLSVRSPYQTKGLNLLCTAEHSFEPRRSGGCSAKDVYSAHAAIHPPSQPEHLCVRSFRNRALNYRRSLWRRLTRELESLLLVESGSHEKPREKVALNASASSPGAAQIIVLKIWHQYTFEENWRMIDYFPHTAGPSVMAAKKFKARLKEQL